MSDGRWEFYFEAPKGKRILRRGFVGITTFELNLWWSYEHKKWCPMFECGLEGASSTVSCGSFKAFKSHLRRHPELQAEGTVVLASWFVGHSITARWFRGLKARPLGRFVVIRRKALEGKDDQ